MAPEIRVSPYEFFTSLNNYLSGENVCVVDRIFCLLGFRFVFVLVCFSEASLLNFFPLKWQKKCLMNKNNLKTEAFRAKGRSVQQNNNKNL